MPRTWAEVRLGKLYELDGETIKLDSKAWFDWLEVNHTFRYRLNEALVFTVRKMQLGRGKFYWQMHHKVGDQTLKQHLAKSAQLTEKLLLTKATEIVFRQTEMAFVDTEPQFPPEITATLSDIQHDFAQDLASLSKHYRHAVEQLTLKAIELDLTLDSETIVRRIISELDTKAIVNLDHLSKNSP